MTPAELEAIRARNSARTPGKWYTHDGPLGQELFVSNDKSNGIAEIVGFFGQHIQADAAFIAHASEDIPALLAEVERLRRALMSSRLVPGHTGDLPTCIWQDEECGCWRHKHNAAIDAALRGEV